ncbi:hypothetical protein [Streptomyces sp. NPDC001744]
MDLRGAGRGVAREGGPEAVERAHGDVAVLQTGDAPRPDPDAAAPGSRP